MFVVTGIGKQDITLGLTWLHEHNSEVNWKANKVMRSCCLTHCHTCQIEVNTECKASFKEAANIHLCHKGPMLSPDVEMEDIPDLTEDVDAKGQRVICR